MPPFGPIFQLSTKHTEEIKVMQAPFKCASMLGHRLRVDRNKASNQSINQSLHLEIGIDIGLGVGVGVLATSLIWYKYQVKL